MEVIKMYHEDMGKRESYRIMNSNETKKMLDADGSELEVKAWVIYEDDPDEKTGDIKKVLTIMTEDDEIFGTISPTFIKEFEKIAKYFGDDVGSIKVITGTSKSGRTYVTCDVV